MRFELLGTGTSQGIPVIGCDCPTCSSSDPRDNRLRCSALISSQEHQIVIDVGPDFRQQMLRSAASRLDAVLITHEHNDHIIGLDDLRPIMFRNRQPMKLFAEERVLDEIRRRFAYAFEEHGYPGAPAFELSAINPQDTLHFGDIQVDVRRALHGNLPVLGYIINRKIGYFTDVNHLSPELCAELGQLDYLLLDMLHQRWHHSHFNFEQAVEVALRINTASTYLIHMSHLMGPTKEWEHKLPSNVYVAYDGLSFEL